MKESLPVSLKYSGKNVDDGSMELGDIVSALQGFSNAYAKIVVFKKSDVRHTIKISGIRKGSADLCLQVFSAVANNADAISAASSAVSAASGIVALVLGVIQLTKHTKGLDHDVETPTIGGDLVIKNCENVKLTIARDVYELYQEGLIAQDLSKIVEPLKSNGVDSVKISTRGNGKEMAESIDFGEKGLFRYTTEEATVTQEMKLTGKIISLNKETNRGSFRLMDGTRVSYKFKTETPEAMYQHFMHRGIVRVQCVAHLDENLKPLNIDITHIEEMQGRLFGTQ